MDAEGFVFFLFNIRMLKIYVGIVRATELERWFFPNNSVIIVSATMKLDQNLVRLTP